MDSITPFEGYSLNKYFKTHCFWHIFGSLREWFILFTMRTIVIHSTSPELRALIRGLLSDIEALFIPSTSREELFRICQTTKCDLILTDDIRLFMNGDNAVRRLRDGGLQPQIFILSHDLSEETVTALLEEGINQFISLPVAPERLCNKIIKQYRDLV